MFAVALGTVVKYVPGIPEAVGSTMSHELIVMGGTEVMDFAADVIFGPIRDAIDKSAALLADPKIRNAFDHGSAIRAESVSVVDASVSVPEPTQK